MKNVRNSQPCISINFCTELSETQVLPCQYRQMNLILNNIGATAADSHQPKFAFERTLGFPCIFTLFVRVVIQNAFQSKYYNFLRVVTKISLTIQKLFRVYLHNKGNTSGEMVNDIKFFFYGKTTSFAVCVLHITKNLFGRSDASLRTV